MAFFAEGKLIAAAGAVATCLLTCVAQAASCGTIAAGFEQWKVAFAQTRRPPASRRTAWQRLPARNTPQGPSGLTAPPSRLSAARSTTL